MQPRRQLNRLQAQCSFGILSKRALPLFIVLLLGWPSAGLAFWPFVPGDQPAAPRQAPAVGVYRSAPAKAAPPLAVNEARMLQEQIEKMADELFANLQDPDPEMGDLADGTVVCTFVDLKKLYRTSSLGRYLAEQMMTEMQQRRYTVVEVRKSQAIQIQEKRGEYGLSRNPAELRDTQAAGAMLTGTYTLVKDQVIVNAKIIDNRKSTLLASATAIIPRNELAEHLLSDPVSAKMRKGEPVYMKRLEL